MGACGRAEADRGPGLRRRLPLALKVPEAFADRAENLFPAFHVLREEQGKFGQEERSLLFACLVDDNREFLVDGFEIIKAKRHQHASGRSSKRANALTIFRASASSQRPAT